MWGVGTCMVLDVLYMDVHTQSQRMECVCFLWVCFGRSSHLGGIFCSMLCKTTGISCAYGARCCIEGCMTCSDGLQVWL